MKSKSVFIAISVGLFFLDRILKFVFFKFYPDVVFLNKGFAFGLPFDNSKISFVMLIVILFLLYLFFIKKYYPILMILLGAISNLFDRFFYDGVIDYINIPFGGVINLADAMIFAGAVFLLK